MDWIGYPHVRVVSDTSFGSDTPKSISNPYPFKKIGFYSYPYPLSSQRIFLLFDQIGSSRKSTDTDTFSISKGEAQRRGAAVEQRRDAAVARRRDWLRRWRRGEIGGAVTLRRDGEEVENWKTRKSGGQWRDRRRWWTVTGPDPNTLPGFPGWSRLVKSHCTIPREYTMGPYLREK